MRVIAWHLAVAATMFAWVAIGACVGEDPEATPPPPDAAGAGPGEFLGPCDAAGKCNSGLVCFEGICHLPPDAAGPADTGTGAVDAGADSDASTDTWCLVGLAEAGPTDNPCPSNAGGSSSSSGSTTSSSGAVAPVDGICGSTKKVCCLAGDNLCVGMASDCDGTFAKPLACSGGDTCGASSVCCLEMSDGGPVPDAAVCPVTLTRGQIVGAFCRQGSTCSAGTLRVCRTDAECTAPAKCRQYEQKADDPAIPLGVCL
jgi:hypothetical protein